MTIFGQGAVQAWANISGDSNPPSLRDDYNVASITDHEVGDMTANFDYDLPISNYAAYCNASNGDDGSYSGINDGGMAVGSCRYFTRTGSLSSGKTDMPLTIFAVFGDAHYGT